MRVAVIGAGKMGLPLACQLARRRARVRACDINQDLVAAVNRGECPIDEPGVPELVDRAVRRGTLTATTDTGGALDRSDVVIVIVPALLTEESQADLTILSDVTALIAERLRPGMMVCYETTVPVGATRRRLLPILERSGLRAGADFDLVYSPERVKSLEVLDHLTRTPKVIGGVTAAATERGVAFYRRYVGGPVENIGSLEAAEFVKLAGMVYRDVNIALANELAGYAESIGVDIGPVIAAANTDGEAHLLTPGIGVGGHCTPVYPHFLINDARRRGVTVDLAESARRINDGQARRVVERLVQEHGPVLGKTALILGLGARASVKEHRFSPAFLLRDALQRAGAEVRLDDPLYGEAEIRQYGFDPGRLDDNPAPCIVILQAAHPVYADLDFRRLSLAGVEAIVDGRALWSPERVREAGILYIGVGRPSPDGEAGPSGLRPTGTEGAVLDSRHGRAIETAAVRS